MGTPRDGDGSTDSGSEPSPSYRDAGAWVSENGAGMTAADGLYCCCCSEPLLLLLLFRATTAGGGGDVAATGNAFSDSLDMGNMDTGHGDEPPAALDAAAVVVAVAAAAAEDVAAKWCSTTGGNDIGLSVWCIQVM